AARPAWRGRPVRSARARSWWSCSRRLGWWSRPPPRRARGPSRPDRRPRRRGAVGPAWGASSQLVEHVVHLAPEAPQLVAVQQRELVELGGTGGGEADELAPAIVRIG